MNVIDTLKAYVKMDARRQWLPAFTAFRYAFEDSQSAEQVSHNMWLEDASQGVTAGPPSSSPGRTSSRPRLLKTMNELITYYQPVMWSERHKRYDCYSVFAYSSIEDAKTKCRLWRSSGYICIIVPYVPSRMIWNEKYNPPDPIPIDSDLPF